VPARAGGEAPFALTSYLVTFSTDGTPVEPQLVVPGGMIDFSKAVTEKEGAVFTAWYEDAEYTRPFSTYSAVQGQMTLYARFVREADALIVTFETFGGRPLQPLAFAKGETLLCKDVSKLYTSKKGYTFGGWCVDEACTEPFGYTDAIEGDMTLYALFVSNEPESSEKDSATASIPDLDWQGEIALTVPEGMTLAEVEANVTCEAGSGAYPPRLSFREAKGAVALYGEYYASGGKKGFEPGATFTIRASGGVGFAGFAAGIDTVVVTVYREEVEIVKFSESLKYILWDHVTSYEPASASNVANGEGVSRPGTIVLDAAEPLQAGDIVALYDGEIGAKEKNISIWKKGSFDGYVLFAQVVEAAPEGSGQRIRFTYANPEDYLSELDAHVIGQVEIDEVLSEDQLDQIKREFGSQVTANDEVRAQMMVAVMASPETQERLDEMYGPGVYQLAGISADFKPNKPSVDLSVSGHTVNATSTVSATIKLKNEDDVILTVNPKLVFGQEVSVDATINGGWLWIDVAATIKSKSTIGLEVTATTGEDSDLEILGAALETLERIVSPDGIDDSVPYEESVSELMNTMQALIATSLPYVDLFVVPLFDVTFTFHGIVSLNIKLELVGQLGVIATFGIKIIVTSGERIGFNYNFKKMEGGSYTQKLPTTVNNEIYLIGKIGVRLGLRLTITLVLLQIATVSIAGNVMAYAELTGMFFYIRSLLPGGSATYLGALNFEVGIDAYIDLTLSVDLVVKTLSKTWTVWQARWPIYSLSRSSTLSFMDTQKLDEIWATASENADKKYSFGFTQIPMKTYTLINGKSSENQLLWSGAAGGQISLTLAVENLVIDGEAVPQGDPRSGIFVVGDGANGRSPSSVYVDEAVAAKYMCTNAECDVLLTYQNASASALVKKQSHTFHLARAFTLSTTTVNVKIVLEDWCASAWGLKAAQWDGAVAYEGQFETSHVFGGAGAPTATGQLDLGAIVQAAKSSYSDLADIPLTWYAPTLNGARKPVQYSVPKISSFCYLTPENGEFRYDVYPTTYAYELVFHLYAVRFPGFSGNIQYVVVLKEPLNAEYAFSVTADALSRPMAFTPDRPRPTSGR
jgi:uncharacterized repeat protein (TIGR02543 family)